MTPSLPPAIAAFFDVDEAGDAIALPHGFAEDAVVIDERRTHTGRDAIAAWKAEASAKYTYTAKPVAVAGEGERIIVTAHLDGDFPGSPIDLRYAFTLARDLITRLEIAP